MTDQTSTTRPPSKRGFAAMQDKDRLREIAAKGGASVPAAARSFAQDRELAREAGRRGGTVSRGGGRRPGTKNAAR